MNTKTLNTYKKLWLANRASHNMALAGPTVFWLASGHREARPLLCVFMVEGMSVGVNVMLSLMSVISPPPDLCGLLVLWEY